MAARAAAQAAAIVDYQRVHGAAAVELARHRFCGVPAAGGDGVCQLDAGHNPPHRARTADVIELPDGRRDRRIIEW